VALSAEYQYERFTRETAVAFPFRDVTTHRVPLGLRIFHPSGLSLALKGTYFNQEGTFFRQGTADYESGSNDFWVLDAGLSYRLPQRYGFITVGATNLLDKQFRYQETDLRNPTVVPERTFFTRVTLAF
jgi:outer membrane receptor for ferrienterochelin and colicin